MAETPRDTTMDATSDPHDITERLYQMRSLLIDRLIEEVRKPTAKASMLNVARQFLWDNRRQVEDRFGDAGIPPKSAGLAHVAGALLALKSDGHLLPFPVPPGAQGITFVAPDDDGGEDF